MSRQNTPGLGIEYEVHIPSYFALLLNRHEEVEDFTLRSNVEEFGNLDDLLVDIRRKNGDRLHFAFQLKHKEKHDKNLLPSNFEAKGDFNLEKYCEAFKKLEDEDKNKYHFILYTNKNFDGKRTKQVEKFHMEPQEQCRGEEFFNTTTKGNIYRFEVNDKTEDGKNVTREDFKKFFQRFTLYTGQTNLSGLHKHQIVDILKHKEHFLKYVDLFRRWHRGEFTNKTLDKQTINIHLIDIFLEPFFLKHHQISNALFESAIRKFDLTIINDSPSNLLESDKESSNDSMLRLAKDIKLIDRSTKELTDDTRLKLLYYLFEKPLIIDFNETSRNLIYETLELYQMQDNRIKFVLVGQQIDINRLTRFKTFTKLKDLSEIDRDLYREIFDKCTLSLQGKPQITLNQLVDLEEEIDEILRPEEILRMLKTNCLIGEDREVLPKFYMPRSLSLTLISIDKIIKHTVRHRDLIIINFDKRSQEFKDLFSRRNIEMVDILKFNYLNDNDLLTFPFVITTDEEYRAKQFAALSQTQTSTTNTHFFKRVKQEHFTLVMSTGNSFKADTPLDKASIEETDIRSIFENPINILSARPGMGKSTLFKSLKNTYFPHMWTVLVELKAHNALFKEDRDVDDILAHLMESSPEDHLSRKLKRHLIERGKVAIFLDGLDEIESICVEPVLEFVGVVCCRGFKVWVSSRQNVKEKIEDRLKIFSMDIDGLTRHQQEEYIRFRLQAIYEREEIEDILRQISNNAYIAKSQQVLGVPLQLYIITEIFQNDRNYIINGNFILTNMYKCFFAGRFKHALDKTESKHKHMFVGELEDQLEKYEIPALQTLFNDDVFKALRLDLRRSRKFIETIKANKDPLGIVVKVSEGDRAVFEHFSFAEYFACVFLVNNFETARVLREHIFSEKYQNLCVILNIMLGEDSPLHLAVIYRDLVLIKENTCESINLDKGGRNLLHLATNNHRHKMNLELSKEEERLIIEDSSIVVQQESTAPVQEIVEWLLESSCNPLQADEIFKMSSLEYAVAYGFLYAVEAILGKIQNCDILQTIRKFWDENIIAYFALRYGYPRLLSLILSQNCIYPLNLTCSMSLHLRSIIDYVLRIDCARKNEIMNILIDHGVITGKIHYGFRILQFETIEGHITVIYLLVKKGGKIFTTFEKPFTFTNVSSIDEDLNAANAVVITKSTRFTLLTLIDQKMDTNTGPLRDAEGVDVIIRNGGRSVLSLSLRDNDTSELNCLLDEDEKFDQGSIVDAGLEGDVHVTFNVFKNLF